MHIPDGDEDEDASFNLTPMIDVVFLLLIFFMVATTYLEPEREIGIELPPAQSGEALAELPDELVIQVLRDGRTMLGTREVDDAGLAALLEQAALEDGETPVTIRGDRLVTHERIVAVMDACGVAGLTNLSVGTLEAGEPRSRG